MTQCCFRCAIPFQLQQLDAAMTEGAVGAQESLDFVTLNIDFHSMYCCIADDIVDGGNSCFNVSSGVEMVDGIQVGRESGCYLLGSDRSVNQVACVSIQGHVLR